MNYFENFFEQARRVYENFINAFSRSYVLEGFPSYIPEIGMKEEDSKLVNGLFAHGELRKKGSSHLHRSPHIVTVHANGRGDIELDKRDKPKEMTLTQWIMDRTGVGHKEASRAAKYSG